jgi:hypothetical protein
MKIPKWEELDYSIRRCLEKIGYEGFLPTDEDTLRKIVPQLIEYEYVGPTLELLTQVGMFEALGDVVLENRRCCGKISDGIYDETVFAQIGELYRQAGKLQVAGLLFMSVSKVAEAKRCLEAASKMLTSAQPKSPWDVLEQNGLPQSEAKKIIQLLYSYPCPEVLSDVFWERSPKSEWKLKVSEGPRLKWITKLPRHESHEAKDMKVLEKKIHYLHKLVVEFSENDAVSGDFWLPRLLLHTSSYWAGVRADHVCFSYGAYELAIQWALGYLQLDLDWFDSVEQGKFAWRSEVREDAACYFEFAGDYTSGITWCEEHNLEEPGRLARLRLLSGDIAGAAGEMQRAGYSAEKVEPLMRRVMSERGKRDDSALRCPACGVEVRNGNNFCSDCGQPIGKKCPDCGEEIRHGKKFCGKCGAKLE